MVRQALRSLAEELMFLIEAQRLEAPGGRAKGEETGERCQEVRLLWRLLEATEERHGHSLHSFPVGAQPPLAVVTESGC